jgi:hypothetical protein
MRWSNWLEVMRTLAPFLIAAVVLLLVLGFLHTIAN